MKIQIASIFLLSNMLAHAAPNVENPPVLRMAKSVASHGITWTFSEDRKVGEFVNGEPWVIGPVTITGIDPNPGRSTDGVQNGSMINPVPNKNFGFDSHPQVTREIVYDPSLNVALRLPFVLNPGDVLVSSIGQNAYPTFLKTVCALTVLDKAPAPGSFRPGIYGNDRSVKWNASQLDWTVLKNYPAVPSTPSKEEIASMLPALPWFEWANIWSGNSLQPKDNTADGDKQYGRETAAKFGQIALWLNTNQPLDSKKAIAIQLVQNGLDIYSYLKNGGGFTADGGHKCGRKLPLVVAAMMLKDPDLVKMAGDPKIFQEDQQVWIVDKGDVGRKLWVPQPGDSWYGRDVLQYREEDVGVAEWGIRHSWKPEEDNRSWSATYRAVVGPGMMGAWLAAYLMDAQTVWNHPAAFAYMERYHALGGDGGTNPGQMNFNREMYAAYKKGLTPAGAKAAADQAAGAKAVPVPPPEQLEKLFSGGEWSFENGAGGWKSSGNIEAAVSDEQRPAAEGSRFMVMNGANKEPDAVLSRSIATVPGTTYVLQFKMGTQSFNRNEQKLKIAVKGKAVLLDRVESVNGDGKGVVAWTDRSCAFTADSASATVEFKDFSDATASIDLLLDDVRILKMKTPEGTK